MLETSHMVAIAAMTALWSATIAHRPLWRYFLTHLITFVHELGHAFVGWLTFRGVGSIKLRFDGSGVTMDGGRRGLWLSRFLTLMFGYPAPILLGAFLLGAVVGDYLNLAMKIMLVFGLFTLLFIRNFWGLLVVLVWILFSAAASFYIYDSVGADLLVIFVATFFIVGGVKDLVGLFHQLTTKQAAETDLGIMQRETFIPKTVTYIFMVVLALPGGYGLFLLSSTLADKLPFLQTFS